MYGCAYITDEPSIVAVLGQETIMSLALNCDIDISQRYLAPYRNDRHAGCKLAYYNGRLYFKDFAATPTTYDGISLLCRVWGADRREVCRRLAVTYGITKDKMGYTPPPPLPPPQPKKLTAAPRPYGSEDIIYWQRYGVTIEQLHKHKVYAATTIGVGDTHMPADRLCYVYSDFDGGRIKIYSPYSVRRKWLCNTRNSDIGMIRHLPIEGERVIITKSFKDAIIIRNAGYEVVWTQSEVVLPPREAIYTLTKRFTHIIIFYDDDETGRNMTSRLQSYITDIDDTAHVHSIFTGSKHKDIADIVTIYGLNAAITLLNTNINNIT